MEQSTTTTAESVVSVRNLAVIMICVSDLERSKRFYTEILGFHAGEQMLEPGVTLQTGDMMIYLADGRTPAHREPESSPEISLCMTVASVRESYEKLQAAGVTTIGELDIPNEYFGTLKLLDPDGNLLQLWGRP